MFCNHCGAQAPDGSAFCNSCGKSLVEAVVMAKERANTSEKTENVVTPSMVPIAPVGLKVKPSQPSRPVPQKTSAVTTTIIVILCLVAFAILTNMMSSPKQSGGHASSPVSEVVQTESSESAPPLEEAHEQPQQPVDKFPVSQMTVSAVDLFKEYQANEVQADMKYKGKVLEVTGTVESIRKDFTGDVVVEIKGQEYFGSVQCRLVKVHENASAQLHPEDTLKVTGTGGGMIMRTPILQDCWFRESQGK